MTTPSWEELEEIGDDDVSIASSLPEITEDDVSLVEGSVFKRPPPSDSGALEDTLQPADFIGPQIGVRTSNFLGNKLASWATDPKKRKMLQTFGNVVGGVTGEAIEQQAPYIESGEDVAPLDIAATAAFGRIAGSLAPGPKGTGRFGLDPMKADIDVLARPEAQAAGRVAKFFDPNIGDAAPTWLSSNARAAMQGSQALAKDKVEGIGRVLGVGAHSSTFTNSLKEEWAEKAGAIIDSPLLSAAKDIPDLSAKAGIAADNVWKDGIAAITRHREELALTPDEFLPLLKGAADTIETLNQSTYGKQFAEGRSEAILASLKDMQALAAKNNGKLDPVDASNLISTINKYRREVLKDFDKATIAGTAQGQNVLKDKELTEGLRDITSALNKALNDKALFAKNIPLEEKELLVSFHDQYGGFSVLEKAADNFIRRTREGASSKDVGKLVGSPGSGEVSIPTKRGMAEGVLNWFRGQGDEPISPQTSEYLRAQTRNDAGAQAVKDVVTLNANPIELPATSASPRQLRGQLAGREAAMTAAGVAAPLAAAGARNLTQADPAQAEMTTPLDSYISPDPYENGLPRDSSAWNDETIARAIVDSATSPKRPIVEQLAVKFKEALRAEDQSKSERILADLAKIAPELFEPGRGINGRLFHKDEQKEYLDRLHKAYRDGTISADFMHKQQKAFDDPTNSLILPLELPQAQWKAKAKKDPRAAGKSPRGLLGGAYAQIGPARQTGSVPGGQYGQFDIAPGMAPRVGPRY